MASKVNRERKRNKEAEWSSDEEYQRSRGSERDWQSDHEWNEDSSLAGEASAMSEGTEEEHLAEEEERVQRNRKPLNHQRAALNSSKLNLDDVGTEDDGESRHADDFTERTDGKYSKTNASDISDMSDIEDQIAEAQNKFMDDKKSLSGMMGLVDEVTMKSEKLTRKASETSLVVERDTFKKGVLSNDQLSLFDDDEISFRSYTERTNVEEDHIPERDKWNITSGRIEYMNYGEREEQDLPKPLGLGHIEYIDDNKRDDSGSLTSEADSSISKKIKDTVKDTKEDEKSKNSEMSNLTDADNLLLENDRQLDQDQPSLRSSKSNETFISRISNQLESKESEHENDDKEEKEQLDDPSERDEIEEQFIESPEFKDFEDPQCSKFGEKHLCCFINLGGGGDDGRENELVNRLRKLKDDIANMRKELSLARQECKKESEEVAKLIEAAAARNKAAEQSEIALPTGTTHMLSTYSSPNYTMEEIMPTALLAQTTILPGKTQVA